MTSPITSQPTPQNNNNNNTKPTMQQRCPLSVSALGCCFSLLSFIQANDLSVPSKSPSAQSCHLAVLLELAFCCLLNLPGSCVGDSCTTVRSAERGLGRIWGWGWLSPRLQLARNGHCRSRLKVHLMAHHILLSRPHHFQAPGVPLGECRGCLKVQGVTPALSST